MPVQTDESNSSEAGLRPDGPKPALAFNRLCKSFDGIPVLREITARFMPGTVNVLAGENGAGKSTLFKIISGQLAPDSGILVVKGAPVLTFDPRHARGLGVSIIPQELLPIPDMKVWQNLLVGRERVSALGFLKRREMMAEARRLLEEFHLDIDPEAPMRRLGVAATQMIEIIKATSRDSDVVLMDEPSSSLSSRETEELFRAIRLLRARGACILYTSHRMEEIEQISDTVAIMRDGAFIRQAPTSTLTERQIITDMVGRDIEDLFPNRVIGANRTPVLEVRDFKVAGYPASTSFTVHAGEILGLGGLVGAGRSELLEAIFGLRKADGDIRLDGAPVAGSSPAKSIRRGIAFVPEDRKLAGVLTSLSILDNVTLPHLAGFTGGAGFVDNAARRARTLDVLRRTRTKYARLGQIVAHLSGGNQQKIALARWLVTGTPRLLILDEPTRGIDVGARSEIYQLIHDLAASGVAVLLASSDMPELINLSHRILVMRGGAIAGELTRDAVNQEGILRLAMGKTKDAA
ncbi:sugar ABC transporter ATP-binding protein [Lichenibacterium ramalinae]|uniref:Sugar ABC transporter ATP-binding protein n=1 Tax=Lichenibacterium ramalinae TaxID=2316527 RepID=A0A4V1RI13_9HYPH|nr:sugar ABC transporter ATP-binding protein [Lichenibacterium ramalinae]RYB01947.1 sugar ABC transporter ATP-binding protein [Lichenibacterium ramalinae]